MFPPNERYRQARVACPHHRPPMAQLAWLTTTRLATFGGRNLACFLHAISGVDLWETMDRQPTYLLNDRSHSFETKYAQRQRLPPNALVDCCESRVNSQDRYLPRRYRPLQSKSTTAFSIRDFPGFAPDVKI